MAINCVTENAIKNRLIVMILIANVFWHNISFQIEIISIILPYIMSPQ